MKDDETIVVGGGIAGLICAARLARAGRPVTVLEATRALGGRAASSDHEGYRVNLGGHALYWPDERRLRAVGVRVSGGHPRPDRGSILRHGELWPWPLPPRLARSALGPRERIAVVRAIAGVVARRPERLAGQSAADWIAARSGTPAVAEMLGALVRISTYAAELEAMPAQIAVTMLRAATIRPVRYLDGGWASIVEALAAHGLADGVRIETGVRVRGLLGEGGVEGVRTDTGAERRSRSVVLAGLSPGRASRLLADVGGTPPALAGAPRVAITAACLDVVLRRRPVGATGFVLGLDEPVYLSTHSQYARLGPHEGSVVHLMRYGDGRDEDDERVRRRLEGLLDLAQPGWRDELLHARFAPRLTVDHLLPDPRGGFGDRPRVTDTGVPGVLIAGDWVGPAGWLVGGSLASGVAAADTILGEGRTGESVGPRQPVPTAR